MRKSVIALIAVVSMFAGCQQDTPTNTIVGHWVKTDGALYGYVDRNFTSDGNGDETENTDDGRVRKLSLTWSMSGSDIIFINIEGLQTKQLTCHVSDDGNTMSLVDGSDTVTYARK